jgi:N-acetylglucosamine kinase-like BadF-type ATPase
MDYVAGLFGGENIVCWISDINGRVLSKSERTGSRYKRDGTAALKEAIGEVFFRAAKPLGIKRVRTISICLPDIDTPNDEMAVTNIALGLNVADNVLVYNDSVALFFGAIAPEGSTAEGVVVIGDLGAVAFGMNRNGKIARAGGWEFFLSDEGSVYWIAKRALRDAMKSYDGRGEKTTLEKALVEHFEVEDARGFVDMFYSGKLGQRELVSVFNAVVKEAGAGDATAVTIMNNAVKELALHAKSVIKALGFDKKAFEIALRGMVFDALKELDMMKDFESEIKSVGENASFIEGRYEPIYGALALALERETGKFVVPEAKP